VALLRQAETVSGPSAGFVALITRAGVRTGIMSNAVAVVRALRAIHNGAYPDYEKVLYLG
jgi:hypothetical protein